MFILFVPMLVDFVYLNDYYPILQRMLPFWKDRSATLLLSDILFIQAALFLVFGSLIAGVILYNAWAALDVRKVQFTDLIWNWKVMDEERGGSPGLLVGLILIAVGIVYILAAIAVTL